jgi:phospholipase C
MMENHSFDNYFGTLGHGEGFPSGAIPVNAKMNGSQVFVHRLSTTVQHSGVPSQTWNASHIQFGDGNNDGFVRSLEETVPDADPRVSMGYWNDSDLPFYAGLARQFTLADHWYSSLLGPTFPNRRFLIAGTANGLIDDIPTGMVDYPSTGTIFDLLDRNGISWTNYHSVSGWGVFTKRVFGTTTLRGVRGLVLTLTNLFPSILKVTQGNLQFTADLYPLGLWRCVGHIRSLQQFFKDADEGTLPHVSIVDPQFQSCSEENPQDVQIGEGYAAEVIKAIIEGKGWPKTLLIWFYDEHGGYYDHVPPPSATEPDKVRPRSLLTAGGPVRWVLQHLGKWKSLQEADSGAGRFDRYGFRVPAVMVSPYSKPGAVSTTEYDHTSALKLIEHIWNLPPLTARDRDANNPIDMLDLSNPALMSPPPLPSPIVPWTRP